MHAKSNGAGDAFPGIILYPGFILIFLFTTDYAQTHPALLAGFGILNVAISIGRALLAWAGSRVSQAVRTPIWEGSAVVSGLGWGVFYGATTRLFGFESWTFLIVTVCVVGVCAAGAAEL